MEHFANGAVLPPYHIKPFLFPSPAHTGSGHLQKRTARTQNELGQFPLITGIFPNCSTSTRRPRAAGRRSGAARAPLAAPSPPGHLPPAAAERNRGAKGRTRATAGTPHGPRTSPAPWQGTAAAPRRTPHARYRAPGPAGREATAGGGAPSGTLLPRSRPCPRSPRVRCPSEAGGLAWVERRRLPSG